MNSVAKTRSLIVVALLLAAGVRIFAMPPQPNHDLSVVETEANAGNPEAQFLLGLRYGAGDGVREDQARAENWLRVAADAGLVEAQSALGEFYLISGPDYEREATKWLSVAADKGDQQSLVFLDSLAPKDSAQASLDRAAIAFAAPDSTVPTAGTNPAGAPAKLSADPAAGKTSMLPLPVQTMPRQQEGAPASSLQEGGLSTGWRTWLLGAIAVLTLAGLFWGRRS